MKSSLKAIGTTLFLVIIGYLNGYTQNINMLSDTGNVGVGTTSPAVKLEVVGNTKLGGRLQIDSALIVKDDVEINKKLTVDQDVKIKGESVFDGNGKFKSELKVIGVAKMQDKLIVDGLGKFNGDLKVMGDFIFGNNKRISYLPPSNGNPEVISFGRLPFPPSIDPCFSPTVTANQFPGVIQAFGNSAFGGTTNILSMGFDGANGIIDMAGTNTQGGPGLLINYYCGKNVAINTGANGGDITMTSGALGKVGIGKNPLYKLDVAGNVSINNNSLFLKDENHGLSQANSLPNVNINGDGPFLYGWGGGALGINHGGTYTKVLSWNENGNVVINADATQPIKSFSVLDITSNKDVFRVMSNGNIFATELTIKLKNDFPDYVFEKNYQLMSLSELDNFIKNQKHLPNIPTAKDVEKNGLSIGEMQVKQLEKIEELTLYILGLHKRIEELEKK